MADGADCEAPLDAIICRIDATPPLSAEEEALQLRRLRSGQPGPALRILVLSNLKLAVEIARSYLQYQQPLSDLIQEGSIGLIKAIRHFEPKAERRLHEYAVRWIDIEISRYVLNNWRIADLRITEEQCRLFVRIRRFKSGTAELTSAEMKAVAASLGTPSLEIQRLEERLSGADMSFNVHKGGVRNRDLQAGPLAEESEGLARQDELRDSSSAERRMLGALTSLDARAQDIVRRRWLGEGRPAKLTALASEYQVSGERIRQIQNLAFNRLRKVLRESTPGRRGGDRASSARSASS